MKSHKELLFTAIMLLILFTAVELIAYAGGRILQSRWGMWKVPQDPESSKESLSFDEYMLRRDPVLGWPYPMQINKDLDANGAQRNPFFPEGGKINEPCLSLYGDSFTEGGDTSGPQQNWGNILSRELNCYVANYGMGGYGTDQAYIRLIENDADISPVTIFGYHPADTLRNLTRIRDLENYSKWYALKPRFIINSSTGELTLIPIPKLSEEEYLRVIGVRGEKYILEHENLQPDGPAGVVMLEFPYTVSVTRNFLSFYGLHSRLTKEPEWLSFLQPGHPLQGLEITVAITRDFVEHAKQRGKLPLVLILPHPEDIEYFNKTRVWPYRHVIEGYDKENIPFDDFGPRLITAAKDAGRSIESYFGPSGHYNDDGNVILAAFAQEMLTKRKLIGNSATQ